MKRAGWIRLLGVMLAVALLGSLLVACGGGKKFTVTFDSDGGSAVSSIEVASGNRIEEPAAPTKDGYTFDKWVKADGSDFRFDTDVITENITLKAIWKLNAYTVTFNTNGGTSINAQEVERNGLVAKPDDPIKAGYAFGGWYTDGNYTARFDFANTKITQDTVIYAYFTPEIKEIFTVTFVGSDTQIAPQTTKGGVLAELPTPVKAGMTFVGWWLSDFEDEQKLTCQYVNQVLTQNTTLFAVWESAAPAVSVTSSGVSWKSKGVNVTYRITITPPEGEPVTHSQSTVTYAYDFASRAEGEYKIEVTWNNNTTTVYYNNKALSRVCLFEVDGFLLKYNAVANAERYLITAVCGNKDQSHTEAYTAYDNGSSTVFNFEACEMQEGGITFVVQAVADGYVSSVSEEFVFERGLEQVSGITVNAETEQFSWNRVENAQYYMVKIGDGEFRRVDALMSASVKEYGPGRIQITVYAVAHGWNASEPVTYTYEKTRLATPVLDDVKIEGQTLSWTAVANAKGYRVRIGANVYDVTENAMQLPEDIDWTNMQISIQAVGASEAESSLFTDIKKFAATLEGQVSYANGEVSWASILGASKYAVKVNDGAAVEIAGGTSLALTFDRNGLNTIAVCFYDKDGIASEWETITVEIFAVTLAYNFEGYDNYAVLYRAQGDDLNLPTADEVTLTGYDFKFWSGETDGIEYVKPTLETAADLTLYAKWEPKQYTVRFSFNADEGTLSGASEALVTYRKDFALPVLVSKDPCKTFYGWFESPNGEGIQYTDYTGSGLDVWKQAGDKILYAGWIDIFTFTPVENSVYGTVYSVAKGSGIDLVKSIKIPAYYNGLRVAYIYSTAFESCANLEVIEIPDTILQVDTGSVGGNQVGSAFLRCNNIQEVNVYVADPDKTYETFYQSVDGVLLYRNASVGSQLELAYFPFGRTGEFTVPDGVEVIPQYVFRSTKITEITIPASVIRIDGNVFDSCYSLTKITFAGDSGASISINEAAFNGCSYLKEITLPGRISEFKPAMLASCSRLETVNFAGESALYASIDGYVTDAAKTTLIYAPRAKSGTVTIPTGITTIAEEAFANPNGTSTTTGDPIFSGTGIEKLIIPGYVTTIEKNAFRGNSSLVTVEFEEGAALPLTIGEAAFYGCRKLTNLVLPTHLTTLGKYAFGVTPNGDQSTNLTHVTVNSSGLGKALDFAAGAFSSIPGLGSSLTQKDIPTYYVTDLHLGPQTPAFDIAGVFGPALVRVTVDPANDNLASDDDVLYNKSFTEILFYPSGRKGEFELRSSVIRIGANVFSNKEYLTGITITGTVTSIEETAFKDSKNLAYVRFVGEGTTLTIGDGAFYGCSGLTELVLPEYTTSIGSDAFRSCTGLTEFTIPSKVKLVGDYAFRSCSGLTVVTLEEGVEELGQYVFDYCSSLETVYFPASLTTIAANDNDSAYAIYNVFTNCKVLKEIIVAEDSQTFASVDGLLYGKTAAENGSFTVTDLYFCPIKAVGVDGVVDIPQTVSTIHAKAFYQNEGIREIRFSNGITGDTLDIGADAFSECKSLQKVELPNGLKTVSSNLFKKCVALTEVVIPNTVTLLETEIFNGCSSLSTITFEPGGTEALVLADGTKTTSSGGGEQYTYYHGVFTNCPALKEITLPERTSKIGAYAFSPYDHKGTIALETITIPASVTEIGDSAFGDMMTSKSNLKTVIFADAENSRLTTIGAKAFYNCRLLTEIEIPASVTSIGATAFSYCYALEKVTFAEGSKLTELGDTVFQFCRELIEIEIPSGVTAIGASAFSSCTKLNTVTFAPDSVLETIGSSAFENCASLQSIAIPASVTSIGASAFSGCTALSALTFETYTEGDDQGKSSIASIGTSAFTKTGLTEFKFPVSTATSISLGAKLFASAKQLGTVYLSKSVTSINSVFQQSYVKNIVIDPENVNFKADETYPIIYNATGTAIQLTYGALYGEDGVYSIPDGTTEIGERAFENQVYIRKMIIPASVQSIGSYAFSNCLNLEEVVFLTDTGTESGFSNLATLGTNVFDNCQSLQAIDLSKTSLKLLPAYTFRNCYSLAEVKLPVTLQRIGVDSDAASTTNVYTFQNCTNLQEINFPDSLTAINGSHNFTGCSSLTTVTLPKALKTLGQYAFAGCSNLTEVTFQSNVTNIGSSPFYYSTYGEVPIEKIVLYSGMTKLGTSMFQYMSRLTTVTYDGYTGTGNALPASITEIGGSAFQYCVSLTDIALPGVTKVGSSVFKGCTLLSSVTLNDDLTTLGNNMFQDCTALTSITLPSKLTFLGTYTFRNSGLQSVVIPAGVSKLGTSATSATITSSVYTFADCANLTSVTLPAGLTHIGGYTFMNCTQLSTIRYTDYTGEENALPDSVVLVGKNAFSGCASLRQLSLPGVTQLGEAAFGVSDSDLSKGTTTASGIETISLPALENGTSTSYLANRIFENCVSLSSVTLSDNLNALSSYMFKGCTALKSITLPSKLVYMGIYTFQNSGLESVTIPELVEHLGAKANTSATISASVYLFDGCENLVSVTLPSKLQTIGAYVFRNCTNLSTITYTGYEGEGNSLPASTSLIGNYSFNNCTSLGQIALPGTTTMGTYLFSGCSALSQVTLSDSLTSIPNSAFSYCTSLTEIVLPESLTSLDVNVFFGSGLTTIEIPVGLTSVGNAAFSACASLTGFTVAAGNTAFKTDSNGFLFDVDGTLICVPKGTSGRVELTEECKAIGDYAFNGCGNVTEVVIPSSVTSIGASAFYGARFTSIVIPESVTSIGSSAFANSHLETIEIQGPVTFGSSVFSGCTYLTTVTFNDEITALGNYMFEECTSLTSITLPSNLTFMGRYTFWKSGIESIVIPETVEHFGNTNGAVATTGSGVWLFAECANLTSVTLPSNLQTVGAYIFVNCSNLTTITYTGYTGSGNSLPESLTLIGDYMFSGCTSLKQLSLPGVTVTGTRSFGVKESAYSSTTPIGPTVACAIESISLPSLTTFGDYLFKGCEYLTTVELNDEVTALGKYTFQDCTALKAITLPSSLTFLGTYTFRNSGLESIVIPEGVVHIGATADTAATTSAAAYVFDGCASLTSVTLPASLQTIGGYVFRNCTNLSTITYTGYTGTDNSLPESVTLVGTYAFSGCTSLEQLSLPGVQTTGNASFGAEDSRINDGTTVPSGIRNVSLPSLVTAGSYLFQNCASLESVILGDELVSLSSSMFAGCTALRSIELPESLTTISTSAFKDCTGIQDFYLPSGVTVSGSVFSGWTAEQTIHVTDSWYVILCGGSSSWIDSCGAVIDWEYSPAA